MTVDLGSVFVEPGYTASDPIDGDISSRVRMSGEVETGAEGVYTIAYDVKAEDGTAAETVFRQVEVKERRIIDGAVISATSQEVGHEAEKIIDGDASTSWKPFEDGAPCLSLVFMRQTLIDRIKICDDGSAECAAVEYSQDGEYWQMAESVCVRDGNLMTVSFDPIGASVVKIVFCGGDIEIFEVDCLVAPESVVRADGEMLSEEMDTYGSVVSENMSLPVYGFYGSTILWESSLPQVISNSGLVTRAENDTSVTLTATVRYKYADERLSHGPYVVRGKSYGRRTLLFEDMKSTKNGGVPSVFEQWWGNNGAQVSVIDHEGNKALCLLANYASSSEPDATVNYNIPFHATMTIVFRVCVARDGNNFKAAVKETVSGRVVEFFSIENHNIIVFNNAVGVAEENRWYDVSVEMDNTAGTASIYMDGEALCEKQSFTSGISSWNYAAMQWRFQAYNKTAGTTISYYIDDFGVYISAIPQIEMFGDKVMNLAAGTKYVEPGYRATDAIDGDITDQVTVTGSPDCNKEGVYRIAYDVATSDGTEAETAERTVFVKRKNLLAGASLNSGFGIAAHLTDGDSTTVWESASPAEFTVDFGKKVIADALTLRQKGTGITSVELYESDDGNNWRRLETDATYGGSLIILNFNPQPVRYLKCAVRGGSVSVAEAECTAIDANVVAADIALLEIGQVRGGIADGDLILPKNGTYGSTISWKSSDPNAISDNGTVFKGTRDKSLTLTATVAYISASATANFKITVPKGASASGGNGGGGGNKTVSITPTLAGKGAPPTVSALVFSDVPASHWGYTYIIKLYNKGIVEGTGTSEYQPERPVTREEYLKLLMSALKLRGESTETQFSDVSADAWYFPYVSAACEKGIVKGTGIGVFGVGESISREDMAVMTLRALEATGQPVTEVREVPSFEDTADLSGYATQSVATLARAGIFDGDGNGRFNPKKILTRAEAAKIIADIMQ